MVAREPSVNLLPLFSFLISESVSDAQRICIVGPALQHRAVPLLRGRHRAAGCVRRRMGVPRERAAPGHVECDLRRGVCVRDSVPVGGKLEGRTREIREWMDGMSLARSCR
jgi:hypothetical protein